MSGFWNKGDRDEKMHRVWRIQLVKSYIKGQVNQSLADLWVITANQANRGTPLFYVWYNITGIENLFHNIKYESYVWESNDMSHMIWGSLEG